MNIHTTGRYAIFRNREFEFECHSDGFWLISDDPNDVSLGFSEASGTENRYIMKNVALAQLSLVFQKATYAYYDGCKFKVTRIVGSLLMLNFSSIALSRRYCGRGVNVIQYNRQDYYMYVPLKDIERIEQEWIPCAPGGGPVTPLKGQPVVSGRNYAVERRKYGDTESGAETG